MRKKEKGSTLLSVMVGIIILFTIAASVMMMTTQGAQQSSALIHGSKSLMYARTAMQNVYQEMHIQWNGNAGTNGMYPDGIWNTVQNQGLQKVENALSVSYAPDTTNVQNTSTSLLYFIQQWILNNQNANWTATVSAAPNGNNFATATFSNLYQKYNVTVTGTDGGLTTKLQNLFTISASGGVSSDTLSAANVFITGAPDISGSIVSGNTVFFNQNPWYLKPQEDFAKYHKLPDSVFAQEPSGSEPIARPYFEMGSKIYTNSIETFTKFSDQNAATDYTSSFGDDARVSGASPAQIASVADGAPSVVASSGYTQPNVATLVGTTNQSGMYKTIWNIIQGMPVDHTGTFESGRIHEGTLPTGGGYIKYNKGNVYEYTASQTIQDVLLFQGSMNIDAGASLTLTKPLFVDGDLVVQGNLNSPTPIYVTGNTRISGNIQEGSHLQIYSIGDIDIDMPQMVQPAPSTTVFQGFFASGHNVYLGGMTSAYTIHGGMTADNNIIVNSTLGTQQARSSTTGLLQSLNSYDTSRRLQIVANTWYAGTSPMNAPTVVVLQAMPQPTLVSQ